MIIRPEQGSGANNACLRIGSQHRSFTGGLAAGIGGVALGVGTQRRNMHHCTDTGDSRRRCQRPRTAALDGIEIACKCANQIDQCIRALQHLRQALGLGYIAAQQLYLAKIAQRLDPDGAFRIAADDPQPGTPAQQFLRHARAQKAAAANQHHQLAAQPVVGRSTTHCQNLVKNPRAQHRAAHPSFAQRRVVAQPCGTAAQQRGAALPGGICKQAQRGVDKLSTPG